MSSADSAWVTTQDATTYVRASVCRTKTGGTKSVRKSTHRKKAPDAAISKGPLLAHPSSAENDGGDDDGVCYVLYSSLGGMVSTYELMCGERGNYKYVQPTADGRFVASYYNAEMSKSVLLGRFVDERTASLAHALARSDVHCRSVDRAAQNAIERLWAQSVSAHTGNAHATPIPAHGVTAGATGLDDGLDFDSLFEMMKDVPGN